MRVKISRLEQALTAEVKRRVDSTSSVEQKCNTMVKEFEERLVTRLEDQETMWQGRMKELEERVTSLEVTQAETTKEQLDRISNKGQALKLQLTDVQRSLQEETKARLVREGRLLQQMEAHGTELQDRWREEQEQRIKQVEEMTSTLNAHEQQRAVSIKSWQAQVTTELDALRKELEAEVEERQQEDEAIVTAMHTYTQQLQHSLSILNGDD